MKEHRVTLVVVAPEGENVNRILANATKHSELDWWIEGDPVVTEHVEER